MEIMKPHRAPFTWWLDSLLCQQKYIYFFLLLAPEE